MKIALVFVLGLTVLALPVSTALATSDDDDNCLVVDNVAPQDVLNVRARPSFRSHVIAELEPGAVVRLDGLCGPYHAGWGARWCPIVYYDDDEKANEGWVRRRYVRDSACF
jgi:hypothetical protein